MTCILVVDDEDVSRDVTARVLRNAGLEVLEARDGAEGLRLARSHVPDLVLVDVVLPDIDGLEVARQLKADPALVGVFVVHLSSSRTSSEDQTKGLDAGADGYIARPVANRELLARVNAFLRLKQVSDALRRSEAQTRLLLEQNAEAARRLQKSEQRYRSLFEQNPDAVYSLDREGRIVEANAAHLQLTGYGADELLGMDFLRTVAPEHVASTQAQFERALQGQPVRYESVRMHKDGSCIAVDVTYQPIVVDAVITGVYGIVKDITERLRAQDQLRELNAELEARVLARTAELDQAREEAELASQAKSTFLAAMSHEIRTPMNGVIGMVDVLQQTSLQGHQVEMVDLVRDSAYSLLGIIEDILDFSKIEAGRMEIEHAPLCLADLVESVCGMLDPVASKRNVQLALFADPAIPSLLVGDEARLRQVLVNLVGNAIKFSSGQPQPGEVAVRAHLRACDAHSARVELSVADNGVGMDPAAVARLFEPFTQGDASTTRRFGGTGLGLAISSVLVKLMGGEIAVRSTLGQGAEFTLALTLARAAGEAPAEPAAALVAGLRCCIVGTDLPLADDLEATLRHAGVGVDRAAEPSGSRRCAVVAAAAQPGADRHRHLAHPGQPFRRRPHALPEAAQRP